MTLYIIIFFLTLFSIFLPQKYDKRAFFITSILLLFLGTFRAKSVGTDTGSWYYYNWFYTTFNPKTWNHFTPFEPGYNLFIATVKTFISSEYIAVYGLTFAISFICIWYVIDKYSTRKTLSLFIFYAFYIYLTYYNLMRQTLAMSLCLILLFKYLYSNLNIFKYLVSITIISLLIHKTSLLFCIFPFFQYLSKIKIEKKILYVILVISVFFFINTRYINEIIGFTKFFLTERYFRYVEWGQQLSVNYSLLEMLMYVCFTCICIFFHKGNRFSPIFMIYYSGVILRALFINLIPIASRVFSLTSIFAIFIIPMIYSNITNKKSRIIFLTLVIFIGSIIFINSLNNNYGEIIPYKFFKINSKSLFI